MIKVASYCRVSTDKDDQANSFEAQQRYFRDYIERQPDWELYQVYADEGITGTSTKKRSAFNRMISDAHMGKFRLIITKEVSRFSRNILDTIGYTRELKQIGVGVLFMNDGISTLEPDAELRLSIMGSIAQEESRKISSRVKWGQTRQMERGVVFGRSLLGYDVKNGCMTVNPEGAELVRLIFRKYGLEKKGTSVIARELQDAGYKTFRGGSKWSGSHILKILKNEKYVGDLVQKKSITPDYLTHARKSNRGEEDLVILKDHHEPIIDRELWNTVQAEIQKRNRHGGQGAGHANRYVFSGKIKCGECGASFVARKKKHGDGTFVRYWSCYSAAREGTCRCDVGFLLRDDLAMEMMRQVITGLKLDREQIIRNVTGLAMEAMGEEGSTSAEQLSRGLSHLMEKKAAVLDAFFSGSITKEEMQMMNERYDREIASLKSRRNASQRTEETAGQREQLFRQVTTVLNGEGEYGAFFKSLLDHMVVYKDRRIEVTLRLLPQKWLFREEENPKVRPK